MSHLGSRKCCRWYFWQLCSLCEIGCQQVLEDDFQFKSHPETKAEQALAIRELLPPFRMIFQRCVVVCAAASLIYIYAYNYCTLYYIYILSCCRSSKDKCANLTVLDYWSVIGGDFTCCSMSAMQGLEKSLSAAQVLHVSTSTLIVSQSWVNLCVCSWLVHLAFQPLQACNIQTKWTKNARKIRHVNTYKTLCWV